MKSYKPVLITLEHISNESDEDSPEVLGLLPILSNRSTMFIIYVLESILKALAVFSKQLQTQETDFGQLQIFTSAMLLGVEELKDFSAFDYENIIETIQTLPSVSPLTHTTRLTVLNDKIDFWQVFYTKIVPFIDTIIENIRVQFELGTLALLKSFAIFDIQNVTDEADYGDKQIVALQHHYQNDFDQSLLHE